MEWGDSREGLCPLHPFNLRGSAVNLFPVTEFHICFDVNKGFILTVRKPSSPEDGIKPSAGWALPPVLRCYISAQHDDSILPPCCHLADIYSITVSTRERNGLFRLHQLNSPPVSHVSRMASAALL